MILLFIAPIAISRDSSAGAETINYYINKFSEGNNELIVISRTFGSHEKKNIHYMLLNKNTNKQINNLVKFLGWILFPSNKYSYKITRTDRNKIINFIISLKKQQIYPDVIVLETTTSILLCSDIKSIFPNSLFLASVHDISYQGSTRKMELEKNFLKKFFRKRYINYAKKNELKALSQTDIILPHNFDNIRTLKNEKLLSNKCFFHLVPFYSQFGIHKDLSPNNNIIFYGLMSRPENYLSAEWFIDNVMPQLPPTFSFVVIGGGPPKSLLNRSKKKILL